MVKVILISAAVATGVAVLAKVGLPYYQCLADEWNKGLETRVRGS